MKKIVSASLIALAIGPGSSMAVTYGCGFNESQRIGSCYTYKSSSESSIVQVAVRITDASGSYYDYGGSSWSLGLSYIQRQYQIPSRKQNNFIKGRHCWQFSQGSSSCANSSYGAYF